ncbi:NAD-dependent epimerase/dehydratase family protein [Paenibacillus sp. A3]|uniref:NAD-dependent epimerase/dehydratase family protein n=1 Tax=Paenibacillus sp. A3 TaxID=1337054 RepID=UPI002357A907|nr:NAD-dependent epimerase/dehydratase family protein [Paenibacillus sp. A3]
MNRLIQKAKFYLSDIRAKEIEKIIEIEQPDIINHHAAQKSVPHSVDDPVNDAEINVMGLINVLNCAKKHKVKRIIFISSGGALGGDRDILPTPETHPVTTLSPYAITKFVSEKYLNYFQVTFGLEYVVLRYVNVYGPRQIADGECGVIPIFMNNILANQPSRLMTYSDMPKGVTRDYVYIDDIKEANILALTRGANQNFNIGSGEEVYIADIYNKLLEVAEVDLPLVREGKRLGDVRRSVLDVSKAKLNLGWEPKTELKERYRVYLPVFKKSDACEQSSLMKYVWGTAFG